MTRPETLEALTKVAVLHDDPPGWMWSASDQMVYACECGDHYVAGAIDVIQEADVLAAADWHRAHLAAALLDAIDAGQVPGLVTAPSEPLLLRLRTMRDRYSERSTWVGFEFPRREAWREIADDLSRLLDSEDGAR